MADAQDQEQQTRELSRQIRRLTGCSPHHSRFAAEELVDLGWGLTAEVVSAR